MSYNLDDLDEVFETWLQTIMDVLRKPMPKIDLALNAGKVGGFTLDDYKQMLDDAILAHTDVINPHELTLEQLGVQTEEELYDYFSLYQNKFNIPLTIIQNMNSRVSVNWSGDTISVSSITPTILGSKLTIPSQTLNLITNNVQYLILNVTMGNKDFSTSYSMSPTPTVSFTSIPLVKIAKNTTTVNTRVIVRIGENELSSTPAGTTIPVSGGSSQAASGTIGTNWFT